MEDKNKNETKMIFNLRFVLFKLIFCFCITCFSCNEANNDRAIKELGIYTFEKDKVKLIVYRENFLLKYLMIDDEFNVLLKHNNNISLMQNWGLYLDENTTLYVLSSDIGHSRWVKQGSTDIYKNESLSGNVHRDSLPIGLLNSFEDLIPY
jgi:hypothetical protein